MKKYFAVLGWLSVALLAQAQPKGPQPQGDRVVDAERKFQILVRNESDVAIVEQTNRQLQEADQQSRGGGQRGILGSLLKAGFGTFVSQKATDASTNLVDYGLNYLANAIRSDRQRWYETAKSHCSFVQSLTTQTTIDDFYALPSTKGAMDPQNLKFNGFGCKNYIEVRNQPGEGRDVFYVFCRLRRDSVGLQHIVNHSKFLVEIDSLSFYPQYCDLPNDSTGSVDSRFDFNKRDNLTLTLKVRLYSSWFNEAIMLTTDQQLGEFTIQARIPQDQLSPDGAFVYHSDNPRHRELVTVEGDCFLVPRSFTGTTDAATYQPAWGTGQYRVEMDVMETCQIKDEYYLLPESGHGRALSYGGGTADKRKWNKDRWKPEWANMKSRHRSATFLQGAWKRVVTSCKGSGWVTTLTSPLVTSLLTYETQKLNNWLDVPMAQGAQAAGAQAAGVQAAGAQAGGAQQPGAQTTGAQQPGAQKPSSPSAMGEQKGR